MHTHACIHTYIHTHIHRYWEYTSKTRCEPSVEANPLRSDSRFREDRSALAAGNVELAQTEKTRIEERQVCVCMHVRVYVWLLPRDDLAQTEKTRIEERQVCICMYICMAFAEGRFGTDRED
jgi:hypothetical protein